MWLYSTKGFVSIVADRDEPAKLLVRGRFRGDVEAVFPGAKVTVTPDADYRYRARVDRAAAGARLAELATAIDYDNFKNAAQPARHGLLLRIWSTLIGEQDRLTPPPRRWWEAEVKITTKPKRRRGKKRGVRALFENDDTPWAGFPLLGGEGR